MESDDILVVTKLDRLGRNTIDVAKTVETLETRGIKVHCLALGGVDLISSAGKKHNFKILTSRKPKRIKCALFFYQDSLCDPWFKPTLF